jgi:hypothetical protein
MSMFQKATKKRVNLRLALVGPSGSGKTFTALRIAHGLQTAGEPIGMIDTEGGSGSRYADEANPDGGVFDFATMELTRFAPADYIRAMRAAYSEGIRILIIDSLSHAWVGTGGVQDIVDAAAARAKGNSFSGWREGTPAHNELIDAILGCPMHLIVTMRVKTEWVIDDANGKKTPRKIGMAPVQRQGMEYEFDVVGDLDEAHAMSIGKTRCSRLDGRIWRSPGGDVARELRAWVGDGAPVAAPTPTPTPAAPESAPTSPAPAGSDEGTVTRSKWAAAEQRAFFAALGKLGMVYDPVCAICAERSRPRPSHMAPDDRRKLLGWLETEAGRVAYCAAADMLASAAVAERGGAE